MRSQLRSELLKQRTTRTNLALAGWMIGLIVLIVSLHSFGFSIQKLAVHPDQLKIFGWGTGIGALFASLAGAMSVTSEFRYGTIRSSLLFTPNRGLLIAAKVTASVLAGLLVGLLAEALTAGLASAEFAIRGVPNTLSGGDVTQLLFGGAAAAALWAVIGTGVGAIVRSQVGAVIGLCVWLLLIESVLIGNAPTVAKFTPGASAGALAGAIQNVSTSGLLAPAVGALLLAGYAVAATAVGLGAFERRDIT